MIVHKVDTTPDPFRKWSIWTASAVIHLLTFFALILTIQRSYVEKYPMGLLAALPLLCFFFINYMFMVMIRPVKLEFHETFMKIEYSRGFNKTTTGKVYYKNLKGYHVYRDVFHFFTKNRKEYQFAFSPYISDQDSKRRKIKRTLTDLDVKMLDMTEFIRHLRWVRNRKVSIREMMRNLGIGRSVRKNE